jgi:hypothetical protein
VARSGEMYIDITILVESLEVKKSPWRLRRRWEMILKLILELGCEGVEWI